jgi:hypothetical protein
MSRTCCALHISKRRDGKELFVENSAFLPKPYTVDQLLTTLIAHFSLKENGTA